MGIEMGGQLVTNSVISSDKDNRVLSGGGKYILRVSDKRVSFRKSINTEWQLPIYGHFVEYNMHNMYP